MNYDAIFKRLSICSGSDNSKVWNKLKAYLPWDVVILYYCCTAEYGVKSVHNSQEVIGIIILKVAEVNESYFSFLQSCMELNWYPKLLFQVSVKWFLSQVFELMAWYDVCLWGRWHGYPLLGRCGNIEKLSDLVTSSVNIHNLWT